ncbi:MAG: RNA 2',3'-cyclic phosphodiesterase [Hyphomicrobiaceae bacterium]|nr:RNA 2',3'-cyclic phosphodiesterase [Hyphomicrobiaceae bacterium]
MPRLFVGLELPDQVRIRLSLVGGPLPGAKWIEAENMHLTLRFAGDIDNRVADELVGFLDEISIEPFEVSIREVGAFGGREPRVIYAGVEGGPRLDQLQRATERAARSAGLPPEPRAFKPHVTLARLKGTRPEEVAAFLGARGSLTIPPFPIERFVLFSSRPRVGGGPYVVENVFPLA